MTIYVYTLPTEPEPNGPRPTSASCTPALAAGDQAFIIDPRATGKVFLWEWCKDKRSWEIDWFAFSTGVLAIEWIRKTAKKSMVSFSHLETR